MDFSYSNPLWRSIAQQTLPGVCGSLDETKVGQVAFALINRRFTDYFKRTPGDCGAATPVDVSSGLTAISVGGAGLGAAGAAATAGLIGGSTVIGVATAGLGLLALPFTAIFQHHAQAVASEQETLCYVSGVAKQVVPQVDALVREGRITAQNGVDQLDALMQEIKRTIDQGIRSDRCNSGAGFKQMADAHVVFARIWYPEISPIRVVTGSAAAPGSVTEQRGLGEISAAGFVPTSGGGWVLAFAAVGLLAVILKR